ncbi:MAG: putative DNA binding domain-containing protein [Planctomycetota bacterium]|nr:putative DNA binding domain-containing protein [Planctomycetota bacterium]
MEKQNIERIESWRGEYLHTVCGLANASGGVLEIGHSDAGVMLGQADIRKLLKVLPNKFRKAMKIGVDVDLVDANGNQYIRITVQPHHFPINCGGKYYYRFGSTTQLLTGNALVEFLLRKQGKTWDSVPIPQIKTSDFESDAFKIFRRKAVESKRLTEKDLEMSDATLLDSLQLTEGNYLRRAALLLFHQDSEKWVPGAFVKIGKFASDTDLLYQHEVRGSLMALPDKVMDAIYLNYFERRQRAETYPVPQAAFREALINALVHRDYSTGIPIQIKVFADKVIIYNDGILPEQWSVEDLFATHRPEPHNPLIAGVFFRSGMSESWGRGIKKITQACKKAGKPAPVIEYKHNREFSLTFSTEASTPQTAL